MGSIWLAEAAEKRYSCRVKACWIELGSRPQAADYSQKGE